jgi:hypothetical protein
MGLFDRLRGKKLFEPQPDDVKMWQTARRFVICEPCHCFDAQYDETPFSELQFHAEAQNTECEAWRLLEKLVDNHAAKQSKEFSPGLEMPPELWNQIITLPQSISKLTSVRRLYLYGSNLVRIPSEIGAMESLEELDIYTSYRLHWLPYEVIRCRKLKESRASTRALYGNYKYRPPFPPLGDGVAKAQFVSGSCSVCGGCCSSAAVRQRWISLRVATDVFPLLVNACSEECIRRLPSAAKGYVEHPHEGGLELKQPDSR